MTPNTNDKAAFMAKGYKSCSYNEKYLISPTGDVVKLTQTKKGFYRMSAFVRRNGYIGVKLSNYYTSRGFRIHQLVAIAFIPNPNNYKEVNHIDGDKTNNNVENLEWCTRSHNIKHAVQTGLKKLNTNRDAKTGRLISSKISVS